jgi:hypothetical protein
LQAPQPVVRTRAKIGNSNVAEAKNVATKSSVIVCTTIGVRQTNVKPSFNAPMLNASLRAVCRSGLPLARIASSAPITATNEKALMA